MLKILFDADMLLFRACASCEKDIEWDDEIHTLHSDAKEVKIKLDEMIVTYADNAMRKIDYEGEYEYILCFSSPFNFRKRLLPTYKANRLGKRKPLAYFSCQKWLKENYNCVEKVYLEADDCIGILATSYKDTLIISGDKDFKTIPGVFYDFIQNRLYKISEEEADYNHLLQTLAGDIADNYRGCPRIGTVTAKRLLDKAPSWDTVKEAYQKAGLPEEEAILQARIARILRKTDYDQKTNNIIYWTPPTKQGEIKHETH